jgi:hypothetical protein
MSIAETFLSLAYENWRHVFPQQRSLTRAIEHGLVTPCVLGKRTISRVVCALDRHQQDWSADYKLYSRSNWKVFDLFKPIYHKWFITKLRTLIVNHVSHILFSSH